MSAVALTVNGKAVTGDVDPRTLLVQFLREDLRLTGTHVGCDTSQCGACVVHVDGKAVKACTVFCWQIEGADVLTIEGLAEPNGPLHPMQEAFREHHGLQCGYCTPGMIMTAVDMVTRKGHDLDDHTIRHELEGNLCRCTGYHNIVNLIGGWMILSKDGSQMKMAPHPAIAHGKANHVGDAVAVVIAETLAQAKDAGEQVKVDYEVLPAVTDPAKAQAKDAAQIHE